MTRQNIGVGVHYLSIPEHHFYRETFGWQPALYPNAMRIGRQTVSIPLSARLRLRTSMMSQELFWGFFLRHRHLRLPGCAIGFND